MAQQDFNIVIMHGRSDTYKKIKGIIEELDFNPIVLMESYHGMFLLKKVKKKVWDHAHCAVIVMTPDDLTKENKYRARQNVIFEMGYCMGAFDSIEKEYWYNAVVIVKEESVEDFSDIHGLEVINYKKRLVTEDILKIKAVLKKIFKKASRYYSELSD